MPYIGRSTDGFGVRSRFVYLATSGATSVSGADANGATLTFTDGAYVDVYLNGVLLKPTTDYNTSTANTIAGLSALNTNDEVTVVVYDVFTVADMVSATSGGTFSAGVNIDGGVVINESSADVDFRVEGNGDANALFVEGETDKVGIGTNDPADKLHVYESSGQRVARFEANNSTSAFVAFKASNTSLTPAIGVKDEDMFFSIGDAVEKMRLNSSGFLKVLGTATSYYGGNTGLYHEVVTDQSNELCFNVTSTNSSYSSRLSQFNLPPSDSTSNAKFLSCYSSNPGGSADLEWYVRVDGQVYADGSFNGGGADYAEFFEWKDGNTSDENRVGCSVVLDGNQIRKATSSDNTSNIIGVISVNPSVVGDADGEFWKGTYLKDDFGKYIFKDSEQVEWTDKEGVKYSFQKDYIPSDVTVPSDAKKTPIKVRTLNSDYDKSKTYERREDRKEWSYVGMMGKLRMLKGQPTGDRWIKMKDISDTVEEWLVR